MTHKSRSSRPSPHSVQLVTHVMHVPVPGWYSFTRGDVLVSYPTEYIETHDAQLVYLKKETIGRGGLEGGVKTSKEVYTHKSVLPKKL